MENVHALLDEIKRRHGIPSDYKLAHFLGLTDGAIRHYRHGRSLPDEMACQKIAKALDIDGDVLAAQMLSMRAKDQDTRRMWERIAERLGGIAACALVATSLVASSPSKAAQSSDSVYYVKY